jgi:hypothetical protein
MSIAKRYAELAGDEANKALQDFLSNDAFDQYAVDLGRELLLKRTHS